MEGNPHGKKIDSCHFEYPGSTMPSAAAGKAACTAFRTRKRKRAAAGVPMKVTACNSEAGQENFFTNRPITVLRISTIPGMILFFSPLVYPGQTVHLSVMPCPAETA